ncbi:hypothetical protein [Vibrio chaetopteri]|uniref:Uncharacterized protein n=1 Tax=Vibrio chaetopteri TaxID=3016528 RepID=A0AAU8BRY7_9VIBR
MSHQRNKNTDTKPLSHAPYSAAQPEVKNRDAEICSLQRSASRARFFSSLPLIDHAEHDYFQRQWDDMEADTSLFDDFLS